MTIINIMGSNAIGKSTRVNVLVEYLASKFDYTNFKYNITDESNKKVYKTIGRLYSNGYLIIGKKNKQNIWSSWDLADFSSWDKRISFFKDINDNYPNVEVIIAEGYFNNRTMRASPNSLRNETGCDNCKIYGFIYNDISEYVERCDNRTGKIRGVEWAKQSSGWEDNKSFSNVIEKYKLENNPKDVVKSLNKDEPKDYFVKELFNDNFEIKEVDNSLDEW